MPTDRFNRLSDEKKKIIRDAAIKEFARVTFEKASINQIIQSAGISRGSFYTYFSDKQDVVSFIFEESHEKMNEQCLRILRQNGGDYFGMIRELFIYFADRSREAKDMMMMIKNVFSYQNSAAILGLDHSSEWFSRGEGSIRFQELLEQMDLSQTWLREKEDWGALMMLGGSSLILALAQFYQHPEKIDEIRRQLDRKLHLLRYGIYQKP